MLFNGRRFGLAELPQPLSTGRPRKERVMKKVIAGSIFALAMMGLAGTSLMQTNPPVQRTPRVGGIPTLTPMPTFTPVGGEPTATATVLEAATPTPTPSGVDRTSPKSGKLVPVITKRDPSHATA
ncbi:MAG: hypothetical protein DMF55_13275 [Acidobacteria bacterium]|nr:MAG: hypothetical protein DMF55_13275 [Acidobacteriota bacterium]